VRFGLGRSTSAATIEAAAAVMEQTVKGLRQG
jgi:cysteine sulfinate desulfinase/cysteine desulfurase-like protein